MAAAAIVLDAGMVEGYNKIPRYYWWFAIDNTINICSHFLAVCLAIGSEYLLCRLIRMNTRSYMDAFICWCHFYTSITIEHILYACWLLFFRPFVTSAPALLLSHALILFVDLLASKRTKKKNLYIDRTFFLCSACVPIVHLQLPVIISAAPSDQSFCHGRLWASMNYSVER